MSAFPRDRYNAEEFVRGFDSANVGRDKSELCISFAISNSENDEMTIWFPGCPSNPSAELVQLARLTCLRISELDNLVQDSCEEEWRRSSLSSDNHELYLAYIEVEANIVRLEYFGTKVNTQWTAQFLPSDSGCWTKVNF